MLKNASHKEKNHLKIMNGHHSIISELVSESSKSIMQFMKVFLHSTRGHVANPDYFSFLSICGGKEERGRPMGEGTGKSERVCCCCCCSAVVFPRFCGGLTAAFFWGERAFWGWGEARRSENPINSPSSPPLIYFRRNPGEVGA